jgi:Fe-S oxidoreductase
MKLKELRKWKLEDELYICAQCGYCNAVCPVSEVIAWESASPRGKLYYLKSLHSRRSKTDLNPEFVNRLFQCSMCGRCEEVCQTDMKLFHLWQAARAEVFQRGLWPKELKQLSSTLESTFNIYGRPLERTWAMSAEEVKNKIGRKAEMAYFVGCIPAYMGRFQSIPKSLVSIMKRLSLDYAILGPEEWCCGNPLYLTGAHPSTEKIVRHNVDRMRELGVKSLVTTCAGCYRAFKEEYPKILKEDLPFEVLHASELLARLVDEGKLKFKRTEKTVTYHDPCELGRYCGVYEAPRKVLENIPGLNFIELYRNKNNCTCCGGGGMLKLTNPELALKIAFKKLDEAKSVGANTIVSGCASCKLNISDAIRTSKAEMEMLDIAEIAASALA